MDDIFDIFDLNKPDKKAFMREGITNKRKDIDFSTENCSIYDLMIEKGNIIISTREINNGHKILFSKVKITELKTQANIFEKGRKEENIKEEDKKLIKNSYFIQRYYLFSKYDEGIKLDEESWFSVTPEEVSKYIANKITNPNQIIIDGFSGCGGNIIQFCKNNLTIANDIDEEKIKMAKHNSKIYNCNDNNLKFSVNNFLELSFEDIKKLSNKNDITTDDTTLFLSPPWGGVNYKNITYQMKEQITPNINDIMIHSKKLSNNIILFLPRNIDINELFDILLETGYFKNDTSLVIDIELIVSGMKIKAILVSIGEKYSNIKSNYLRSYISKVFNGILPYQEQQLLYMIKEIGLERFVISYINSFKDNLNSSLDLNETGSSKNSLFIQLIKYIKKFEMTQEELENFKRSEKVRKKDKSNIKQVLSNERNEIKENKEEIKDHKYLDQFENIDESDFNELILNQL